MNSSFTSILCFAHSREVRSSAGSSSKFQFRAMFNACGVTSNFYKNMEKFKNGQTNSKILLYVLVSTCSRKQVLLICSNFPKPVFINRDNLINRSNHFLCRASNLEQGIFRLIDTDVR